MVSKRLFIGMDYEEAKGVFVGDRKETLAGSLSYFTVAPDAEAYGIHPVIQVTAKSGKVIEILATPDWKVYGKHKGEEDIMPVWEKCIRFAASEYGKPYKSKEWKKAWMLPDGSELKIKMEKGLECSINILIS